MLLRAKAKGLAHTFVRLHAYLRNEFDLLRDAGRGLKALKTRPPAKLHRTAIHEAGHAVLQIALGLDIVAVSIIPDLREGTAGWVLCETDLATAELHTVGREAFSLGHVMACYAGAEAIRQLIPTDTDPDAGASRDEREAAKLIIDQIGGPDDAIDFLYSLAKRRCALLVAHYQPEIQALAAELEAKLILSGKVARKVFMKSLTKRAGRLMTFENNPTSHGLVGDEAYQSFLRRINLPGRLH